MIINMTGGGGGKLFAAIGVIFKEGSTCTCVSEETGKTLTSRLTDGQCVFAVPYTGTWVVTATNGAMSASKTVEITAEGQAVCIVLLYELYLFKSGEGAKVEFVQEANPNFSVTYGTEYIETSYSGSQGIEGAFGSAVDITNYKTLNMRLVCTQRYKDSGGDYSATLMVATNPPTKTKANNGAVAELVIATNSAEQTVSMDVTDLTGDCYVTIWGGYKAKIYDWWLE